MARPVLELVRFITMKSVEENQYNPNCKCGLLGCPRDSLGPFDQHLSILRKIEGQGIFQRKMEARGISAQVDRVDQVLDNLAEGQCHYRQIVAAQAEHRDADEDSKGSRHKGADHKCNHHRQGGIHGSLDALGKQGPGKGSHAHKARMAQAQLTQDTYREI